jgi:hypothetical protein
VRITSTETFKKEEEATMFAGASQVMVEGELRAGTMAQVYLAKIPR